MARINWGTVPHDYHMGVSKGVLYLQNPDGTYEPGVAWNGLRSVSETPTGGTVSKIYADDMQYGSLRAQEGLTGRIEAYAYPDEFILCTGYHSPAIATLINLQKRRSFGFCYRTMINQEDYILHILFSVNLNPGEVSFKTAGESVDVNVYGWEYFTIPSVYKNRKPASLITIDSRKISANAKTLLENLLYGTENTDPTLLKYEDFIEFCRTASLQGALIQAVNTLGLWRWDTLGFHNDSVTEAIQRESSDRVKYEADSSEVLLRPGIVFELANENQNGREYSVTAEAIPADHSSMIQAIESIPNTILLGTRTSTEGYVFYDYSIFLEEEN